MLRNGEEKKVPVTLQSKGVSDEHKSTRRSIGSLLQW